MKILITGVAGFIGFHVAERLLAHEIGSAVEVAYHREPLLDERREVLQNWADYVLSEVK